MHTQKSRPLTSPLKPISPGTDVGILYRLPCRAIIPVAGEGQLCNQRAVRTSGGQGWGGCRELAADVAGATPRQQRRDIPCSIRRSRPRARRADGGRASAEVWPYLLGGRADALWVAVLSRLSSSHAADKESKFTYFSRYLSPTYGLIGSRRDAMFVETSCVTRARNNSTNCIKGIPGIIVFSSVES